MTSHLPPVPPDQRSPKGPQSPVADNAGSSEATAEGADSRTRNLAEQGRQGNSKQNTTNKGYQQDR